MSRSTRRFIGHYLEMVLAMLAGMGILGGIWMVVWPGIHDHTVVHTLVMAGDMTMGMAGWMAFRGHSRTMIVEMSAAMVAPFLVLLVPLAVGSISADTLMIGGHVLMLFTMLAAMLPRRHDYSHHHAAVPEVVPGDVLDEGVATADVAERVGVGALVAEDLREVGGAALDVVLPWTSD